MKSCVRVTEFVLTELYIGVVICTQQHFVRYNVKRKDDGMNQNKLQCCYSHSVTTNQQIYIKKTRWRENILHRYQSTLA